MSRLVTMNYTSRPARPRPETLNGRRFLAVPVTLIVPGCLDGSNGPLLYQASELQRTAGLWDRVPLTLGHPTRNGEHISAMTEGVQHLGFVRRPVFTDRLKAEAWFDIERTRRLAPALLADIEAGRPVEVSTGLFTDDVPVAGSFKGRPYRAVARNHRPDHLAVLLDSEGACSLADGCGLNVNQCKCAKCSTQSRGRQKMRGKMKANSGYDMLAIGEALGVICQPSTDPVGYVAEMRLKMEEALAQLNGDDGEEPAGLMAGNRGLPSYLRGVDLGRDFDPNDTIPDAND